MNHRHSRAAAAVITALLAAAPVAVYAQKAPQQQAAQNKGQPEKVQAASAAAAQTDPLMEKAIFGPKTIDLGSEAKLNLPASMAFLPKDEANQLMDRMGNSTNPNRYGLVFPTSKDENALSWIADLAYEDSGYIKDDDAKDWDAEAMLKQLKEGNDAQNEIRRTRGLPEVATHGWVEKPQYDAATHRLIWSIDAYEKGNEKDTPGVNYNTFQLGRKGYISMTMVTDLKDVEALKPVARDLLANISFNEGLRYQDFNAATDKVAEYGLMALVGGVAAKKLGLLAVLGAFLLKFSKLIIVAVLGAGAAIRHLLGRKKRNDD